ncbi:MAG TPA: hypothetical protein VN841_05345 [Bryobacteraceae bacterium]|nr:hypothetical protein [Bryobacteraceae bacterium]
MKKKMCLTAVLAAMVSVRAQSPAPLNEQGIPMGALAPASIAKSRPAPPFDLTGTWLHSGGRDNPWQFSPPPGSKLLPKAQAEFDAYRKAQAEGKSYKDDIGHCWPAGLPIIMTRVWPIAVIQKPTSIYMISGFMNSVRIIYMDGRKHTDPDVVISSFNGESIGHWEKDTLVVDTTGFVNEHHWIDNGVPASDALHVIERMRLLDKGATLEIQYAMTDPKSWEGEWKWTKRWKRVDDQEITEAECLPDLNSHLLSTNSDRDSR